MISPYSLTPDQVDVIDRSLNKSMALARVLAEYAPGGHVGAVAPDHGDIFLVMQVLLEELEKIQEITRGFGNRMKR